MYTHTPGYVGLVPAWQGNSLLYKQHHICIERQIIIIAKDASKKHNEKKGWFRPYRSILNIYMIACGHECPAGGLWRHRQKTITKVKIGNDEIGKGVSYCFIE